MRRRGSPFTGVGVVLAKEAADYLSGARMWVLEALVFLTAIAAAYAAILVAEEVLDVMQRDWMRDERVVPFVRTVNNIHVVEESRHMKFAREETKARLAKAGWLRRQVQAIVVAGAAHVIVSSMWNKKVYERAGLDVKRAVREAKANEHHKSMLRSSCAGLMEFLNSAGLLTKASHWFYKRANLL